MSEKTIERCGGKHRIMLLDNSIDMGGLEKKLFDFVSSLDRDHFDVVVCCLKKGGYFGDAFKELGFAFYENLLGHKYDFTAYRRFAGILAKERIELIYSFLHPNTVIFSSLAKRSGKVRAWIVSVHATGTPEGGKLIKWYLKPWLGKADRFIAVADSHRDYLVSREGVPRDRITVIHNGVDVSEYRPDGPDAGIRESLGIGGSETLIVTVASLKPLKCIDVFLEACARVARERRDARFLVVGDGPQRRELEELAGRLGIGDRVVFTGVRDDVPGVLREADLFVLSSRTEAFPNAVLEAMASGLPVVATDVGSMRELVEDGVNGILVPPLDAAGLARAILDLLGNTVRMKEFGNTGRKLVEERFTLAGMNAGREELFASLLCR